MKILRSVTRRSDNLGTAGFFSGLLRPTTWFAASRLPTGSRFYQHQSTWTATAPPPGSFSQRADQETPAITTPAMRERWSWQRGLIVIAAIAISLALLWWTSVPR